MLKLLGLALILFIVIFGIWHLAKVNTKNNWAIWGIVFLVILGAVTWKTKLFMFIL